MCHGIRASEIYSHYFAIYMAPMWHSCLVLKLIWYTLFITIVFKQFWSCCLPVVHELDEMYFLDRSYCWCFWS